MTICVFAVLHAIDHVRSQLPTREEIRLRLAVFVTSAAFDDHNLFVQNFLVGAFEGDVFDGESLVDGVVLVGDGRHIGTAALLGANGTMLHANRLLGRAAGKSESFPLRAFGADFAAFADGALGQVAF